MKSQLFPQLDKGCVDRLLRGGLQVSPKESTLLHAASRLTQLGILKTVEVHAIRCANPADADFPDEVVDESCPGILKLPSPGLAISQRHPIYQCHHCGRVVEYPGVQKEIFRQWETAIKTEGISNYVGLALEALLTSSANQTMPKVSLMPQTLAHAGLSVSDLLTKERSWLARKLAAVSHASSINHRQRRDLSEFSLSLLDAFPTKELFAQMLRFELNRNLDAIALGESLTEVVRKVIVLAETEGWLPDLLDAAKRANHGNSRLRQLSRL